MTVIIFDKNGKVVAHKAYEVYLSANGERYSVLCNEFRTMKVYDYNIHDIKRMTIDYQTIIDVGE